jgi:hypothetical protein
MKLLRTVILAAATAAALVSPLAAMNNRDIIKMKEADLSESTILMAIGKEPADYDTSPDGLVALKKAGVSETIIQKIINLGAAPAPVVHEQPTSAPAATVAAAPTAAPAPVVTTPAPSPVVVESPPSAYGTMEFPQIAPPLINPVAGQEYFLRSSLHFEDGEYVGTNYARGTLVPVNTPVKIDAIKGETISLHRIDTGDKLTIKNVDKYTKKSMTELARLIFADQQTPLDRLPADLASSIKSGEMRLGMTKEQVLMARGYPPAHETPSIDSDRWVYWSSRFVKQTIVFTNGRVTEGRGLR